MSVIICYSPRHKRTESNCWPNEEEGRNEQGERRDRLHGHQPGDIYGTAGFVLPSTWGAVREYWDELYWKEHNCKVPENPMNLVHFRITDHLHDSMLTEDSVQRWRRGF
jgi:hypothetical protein